MSQLVNMGAPEATELVAEAIRRGDPTASYSLPMLLQNAGPAADELIDEASHSELAQARSSVANALSGRGDDHSLSVLDQLSRDEDPGVKSAAMYALANTGSSESIDRLINIAQSGENADRGMAISALANTGDPRATPIIADGIRSGDPQLVQSALYGAYNAGPEVDSALVDLAEDPGAEMYLRTQALQTLTTRGVDTSSSALEELRKQAGIGGMGYGGFGGGRYYPQDMYFEG
jgi:HEAT repeat protein